MLLAPACVPLTRTPRTSAAACRARQWTSYTTSSAYKLAEPAVDELLVVELAVEPPAAAAVCIIAYALPSAMPLSSSRSRLHWRR